MTEVNPPYVLQATGQQHPANLFRRALQGVAADEGIAQLNGLNDLVVTESSPPALSVVVARGGAFILGDDVQGQGMYFVYNDADKTIALVSAHATLPRKDIIVARVKDATHGQTGDTWTLEAITGTAASSPVEPAVPATALKLATVSVGANVASVLNADITDARVIIPPGAIKARRNSTGAVLRRRQLNFIEGSNVQITLADDPVTDELDVTLASTAASAPYRGCRVYLTANQAIPANGGTVQWNGELWDTSSIHDNVTNSHRFTVPTGLAGKWALNVQIYMNTINFNLNRYIYVRRNGVTPTLTNQGARFHHADVTDTSSQPDINVGAVNVAFDLAVGDYVDVFMAALSTSGYTVYSSVDTFAHFHYLGA